MRPNITAVEGTSAVLEHATRCAASRVLVISSGAVYGGPHAAPIGEHDFAGIDPTASGSDYAMAKLAAESVVVGYGRDTGLDVRLARARLSGNGGGGSGEEWGNA